jgi:hypothetical protein
LPAPCRLLLRNRDLAGSWRLIVTQRGDPAQSLRFHTPHTIAGKARARFPGTHWWHQIGDAASTE